MNTISTLRAKRATLAAEVRALASKPNITLGEDERLTRLTRGLEKIDGEIAAEELEVDERRQRINDAKAQATHTTPGYDTGLTYWRQTDTRTVFEDSSFDPRARKDQALRAADLVAAEAGLDVVPSLRSHIERSVDFADNFRATADPDYLSAFGKLLTHLDAGRALVRMSDAERNAMSRVADAEARAMSTVDTSGGYAIPQLLDPQLLIHNAGTVNPIRQLARKVTGISDKWNGISTAGITASWDGEGVEVSDDSPTLASVEITAYKGEAFIPFSLEVEADWQGMVTEMQRLIADSRDRLEATAFATGSGSGQPYGILTRLAANTNTQVTVTTDGAFGEVDVYNVFQALPARYRSNSAWVMNLDVQNEVRNFTNSQKLGAQVVNMTAGYSFELLGRPVYEASDFPTFTGTTGAANILVVGDWSNYIIFDRLGSTRVELVPHLLGSNGRPTGQRGILAYFRTGADVASTGANPGFKLLINS